MANYYVNLDEATLPGSAGTATDPFGEVEYRAAAAGVGPHTFYMRGRAELAADLINGGQHTHQAWDVDLYGPWGIHSDTYSINNGAAANTYTDGIIDVVTMTNMTAALTRCHVASNSITARGNIVNCNLTIRTGVTTGAGCANVTNCSLHMDGNLFTCGAATTFTNNVTDAANFAALAINGGAAPVDGGGNTYSATFPSPDWDDSTLTHFSLFPTHGCGACNAWAEPRPMYIDASASWDDTYPRRGDIELPAAFDDEQNHTSRVADRTYRYKNVRTPDANISWYSDQADQLYDGWDGNDPYAPGPWGIKRGSTAYSVDFLAGANQNPDALIWRRFACDTATQHFDTALANYRYKFQNCYFRQGGYIEITTINNATYIDYDGCTFKTPVITIPYLAVALTLRFRRCLFDNTVFEGGSGLVTITFEHCKFVGKTHSQINQMDYGAITFTDCEYEVELARDLPTDIAALTDQNLRYSMFGLPEQMGSSDTTDYGNIDIDYGFNAEDRQGVGAFFFGMPAVAGSAAPDSGPAPHTVECTGEDDAAIVKHHWDFGDGEYSDSRDPTHTYDEPGTYTGTYTAYDALGYSSSITFTVYVYDQDYETGYVVTETDYCARMAIEEQPAQGVGWSEYGGSGWPMPLGIVGSCEVIDNVDDQRVLVMDSVTFKVHELGVVDLWRDSETEYGGVEQEAEILWPEEVPATRAVAKLEHSQSHLYVKPWYKDRRNEGDYGADGYRPDFEMDMFLRQNALPTDAAVTRAVPVDGQLTVDRHFATGYLQMGCRIRTAPWRLTGAELWVREIDTGGSPAEKRMTELKYADEWSEPHFWFSRGYPILNRATGQDATATYAGTIVGPDLYSNSGVVLAAGQSYEASLLHDLTGGFTFNVWLRSVTEPSTILRSTSQFWRIDMTHDGALRYQDDSNDLRIELARGWGAWRMLTVVRSGEHLAVYSDGDLVTMYRMHYAYTRYSGDLVLFEDGMAFFDARLVARTVSAGGVKYLYRDIVENRGNATCPAA